MERNRSVDVRHRSPSGAAVRRADVTDALARAFFAEWALVGYAALSLERVARAAGSGKAALYRRWPDKAAMASDLLPHAGLELTDVGDNGSFEADVTAFLLAVRRVFRHRVVRRIVTDIHSELERNPQLAAAVRPFQDMRRARAVAMVDRAIARAELPLSVDRDLVTDLLAAPLYWRMAVLGQRADRAYVARLARTITIGARDA